LQAVGLILVIALLIIPAAAARFWTERLGRMFIAAGAIGAGSGWSGAIVSALFVKLPSGAMIVLVCTALFVLSMIFGGARGMLFRAAKRIRLNRSVQRQHLLRAMYELIESSPDSMLNADQLPQSVTLPQLLTKRSWTSNRLSRTVRRAQRNGLVASVGDQLRLTRKGVTEAARLTRQHRLWELYLVHYAEIAPSRVDREADAIEHVLEPEVVEVLETLLDRERSPIPASPHDLHSHDSVTVTRSQ